MAPGTEYIRVHIPKPPRSSGFGHLLVPLLYIEQTIHYCLKTCGLESLFLFTIPSFKSTVAEGPAGPNFHAQKTLLIC